MKTFEVEITNSKATILIVSLSLLWVALSFALFIAFGDSWTNQEYVLVILAAIPFYPLFLMFKSIPVEKGEISLDDKSVYFDFKSLQVRIPLNEISNYKVHYRSGVTLELKLKSGKRKFIGCSDTFSDPHSFDVFCAEFENTIAGHNARTREIIKRKKTFHEKRWALPVLLVLTVVSIGVIVHAIVNDNQIPGALVSSLGLTLTMWGSYWNSKRKKK